MLFLPICMLLVVASVLCFFKGGCSRSTFVGMEVLDFVKNNLVLRQLDQVSPSDGTTLLSWEFVMLVVAEVKFENKSPTWLVTTMGILNT